MVTEIKREEALDEAYHMGRRARLSGWQYQSNPFLSQAFICSWKKGWSDQNKQMLTGNVLPTNDNVYHRV